MKTKKHLGQHFLKNRHVIDRIIEALEGQTMAHLLEIGPGPGTLTFPLHRLGYSITAVEADPDMVALLREEGLNPPLDLIEADFMDVDLQQVVRMGTRVVSNLPYNVSVPITARLLEAAEQIPMMVMMYQKEVAERIRGPVGTRIYGPISVLVRLLYEVDLAFNVKPGSFHPPPKVDSQVLRMRRLRQPLLRSDQLGRMTELVRFLFTHRRKMLATRLKKWDRDWTDAQTLIESLIACGLDPKSRPENLGPSDYAAWLNCIEEGI